LTYYLFHTSLLELVFAHKNFKFFVFCESSEIKQRAGIATGCGLDDQMVGVQFPVGAGNISLQCHVQTSLGAHPASYSMGTGGSFPGGG
jgi:hypothetical protein